MTTTTTNRRARFKRDQSVPLQIQDRDKEIIQAVFKYRFLTSEHISALVNGSHAKILRRLHKLYHAGFLDRPKAQLVRAGNFKMIYALGNEGAKLLASEYDIPSSRVDWTTKNREAKGVFIEHTLMVSNFLVALQTALRKTKDIEFIDPEEIIKRRPGRRTGAEKLLSWQVKADAGKGKLYNLSIVPDTAFGLRFIDTDETAYFFVECDRATMPIQRSNLNRSSYAKKLFAYYESWKQSLYRHEFGFGKPRILTITTSEDRIKSMVEVNRALDTKHEGFGFFLFTPQKLIDFKKPELILEKIWKTGKGEKVSIID